MDTKKILSAIVAGTMALSTMGFTALADGSVAEVNGKEYGTVAEAISVANDGDVVTILVDVDGLPVIDKAITIKGADGENKIKIAGSADENQFTSINGTVTIENLEFTNGNEAIRTDYLSANYDDLELVIKDCDFNNLTTYAIMGGKTDPDNHVLGSLVVDGCTFTSATKNTNYMVYAQCVGDVTVKNSVFNGEDFTKGAINLGDSTVYATTAVVDNNTINGVARGIQIGNRGTKNADNEEAKSKIAVTNNIFTGIGANAADSKPGAIYLHSNSKPDNVENVEVTGNDFVAVDRDKVFKYDGHEEDEFDMPVENNKFRLDSDSIATVVEGTIHFFTGLDALNYSVGFVIEGVDTPATTVYESIIIGGKEVDYAKAFGTVAGEDVKYAFSVSTGFVDGMTYSTHATDKKGNELISVDYTIQ